MSASQYLCWVKWYGAANQDLDKEWGCVTFSLRNFVSAPFYLKLHVMMFIHPGKLIWRVQVALMKSTVKGYTKTTQAQKTPNILKLLLWSYLVVQSEIFKSFFWKQNYPKITQPCTSPLSRIQLPSLSSQAAPSQVTTSPSAPMWVKAWPGWTWETEWFWSKPIPGRWVVKYRLGFICAWKASSGRAASRAGGWELAMPPALEFSPGYWKEGRYLRA